MSRDAKITLDWADGSHDFRLAWKQLIELQEKCDAGPNVVLQRLFDGTWRMQDISETIRVGLIGGGMKPSDALKLVRTYVEDRPPMENVLFAQAVLGAGLMGARDETLGKAEAPDQENGSTTSPMGSSDSEPSTEPVLQ